MVRVVPLCARLAGCRSFGLVAFNDVALDALAMAAPAQIAMARAAAAVTVFVFLLGLAMGALVRLDQRLPVGDRDLVIIGMDFAEGQKAVPVPAIFDKRGLQGWFD